jgi:hypothetical protein
MLRKALVVFTLLAMVGGTLAFQAPAATGAEQRIWLIDATDGLRIGGYGDNFAWDGTGVAPVGGDIKVRVNAGKDVGAVIAKVYGTFNPEDGVWYTGEIVFVLNDFEEGPSWQEGGIVEDVTIHGNTGLGPAVMPVIRTYLGGWGTANVYVNGELVYEGLDAHFMYTERVRRADYTIRKADGTIYNPMMYAGDYPDFVSQSEREVHLVAHSTTPDSGNFPPHSVWFHLNWQDVTVKKAPGDAAL